MTDFERSILNTIANHPGIKAKEIAQILNCEKTVVNFALFGELKKYCYQDSFYNWFLNEQKSVQTNEINNSIDEHLSNVCKYYLNCLGLEESKGISSFLTSNHPLNYAEIFELSLNSFDEKVDKLIQKTSVERNLTSHIGYPVMIEKIHSTKTNQDYLAVAPVFLFPVEISNGAITISSIPHLNIEVVRQYSLRDENSYVYDLIELENELGLNNTEVSIELDELVARLQSIRKWQWRDELNPNDLKVYPPIEQIVNEGIYNKAIFIVSEKSPYTVGLESELSQLSQMSEDDYRNTALYDWIHGNTYENTSEVINDTPLLEVLPMNSEQEQAVFKSLRSKLTVVTGPPGTGKSQVVTNLLVNESWNGKKALFTSKNNKAVDVVETRVNSLSQRPAMLRIGSNQYAHRLAEIISGLLSSTYGYDQQEYSYYHSIYQTKLYEYDSLKEKKDNIINLRNHVDHLEQKVCGLRDNWEKWFEKISNDEINRCETIINQYSTAFEDWWSSKTSFFGKLFWFAIGKRKTEELNKCLTDLNQVFNHYGQTIVTQDCTCLDEKLHQKNCCIGKSMLYSLHTINEYNIALDNLLSQQSTESIDKELIKIKSDLAKTSQKMWNEWLQAKPLKISSSSRREMSSFVSTMNLLGDVNLSDFPDVRRSFNQLQEKMTEFLPCWAITSLSAKGRIPLTPGMFDLVVIDEASQCDIASVLPMLYRAKRAVIIGDSKQLSHISTISKVQDLSLLQKYNIDFSWSYSSSSLYSLACSLSNTSQIITLKDHHRSFGDIIEFSNKEFYSGELRVVTNYEKLNCPRSVPAGVEWIDVVGKTIHVDSRGNYNEAEATVIVEELKRLVMDDNYTGSVGVVTPFKAQAELIYKMVERESSLRLALLKNDFLVDTVHKFQGDERDLILFSPVISYGVGSGALKFLKNTGNLFNVAITRARAVLIVVGDLNYCSKCNVSYLEHFANYVNEIKMQKDAKQNFSVCDYPNERLYPYVNNEENVSEWERYFYTALFDQGIQTIPQYSADKYKLDFAIINENRMLDIEIDGEMYHKDWNGELSYRDQLRNQRLFELGWDVKRFWVYQIRDDLQGCINEVKRWMEDKSPI